MRKFVLSVLALVVIGTLALAGAFYWLTQPVTLTEDTFVQIDRGTSTREIAEQLAQRHIIRSPYSLWVVRLLRRGAKLQAGEYEFSGEVTPWQVFDRIRLGLVFYELVTVPEGSNIFDIAALLGKTNTVTASDFLAEAKNPALIGDLDAQAPTLEGYLFPSTYRVTHKTTAKDLCRMMTEEFRHQWKALHGTRSGVHRTMTLASLVEKEAAIPNERPLIAAVFDSRLKLNMPLQCDPTTVYAALVENRYRGIIYKSDLASKNAYNTYAHAGLPPGPIANPGAQSIKAALEPARTKVLFFVAKGDGSGAHYFSATLAEHEKAVAQYRKTQR